MGNDAEDARGEYARLLEAYGEAVERRQPDARVLYERAEAAWKRLCSLGGPEAETREMHVVLAFSRAVAAGDAGEAQRLYDLMSPEYRRTTDLADARYHHAPGSMKIWLRKPVAPPPFADAVLEQSDPAAARTAAEYEHWKWLVGEAPTASAFENLGRTCERLARTGEALDAYEKGLKLATDEGDEEQRRTLEERVRALRNVSPQ